MGVDCIVNEDDVRFLLAHIQAQREVIEGMTEAVSGIKRGTGTTSGDNDRTYREACALADYILAAFAALREKNKVCK